MGSSKKQTLGYKYLYDLLLGMGFQLDGITEIRGGERTAWKGHRTTSGIFRVDAPKLYGGDKQEGGIVGDFELLLGEPSQQPNAYLKAVFGPKWGAMRDLSTLLLRRVQLGSMNPYPKALGVRGYRALSGWDANGVWYPEKALIPLADGQIRAMNPAHILYATVTDLTRGQQVPRGQMHEASWRKAADTLYAEGFGLCAKFEGEGPDDLLDFQQKIVDLIGGALQQPRGDGLYYLDLIRDDYDVESLPIIGEDDVLSVDWEPSVPLENINEMVGEWFDPIKRVNRTTVPARRRGLIASAGGIVSQTRTMREVPVEVLANLIILRDLAATSTQLARLNLVLNHRPYSWLRRGRPFRLQLPKIGIGDMVCRADSLDLGELRDGRIKLKALQDVLRMPSTVYLVPQQSEYVPPSQVPVAAPQRRVFEAPYVELAGNLAAPALAALAQESGFVAAVGSQPSGLALNYALATAAGGETYQETNLGDWCPTATVSAADTLLQVDFVLSAGVGLDQVEIGSAALWGDEIVRVDTINPSSGAARLARACGDTVPTLHPAGERIWFYDAYAASDEREYVAGETVNVKLLTRTPSDQLAIAAAPIDSVVMARRAARPYPPANLKIKGLTQPVVDVTDPVTLTWSHRDRLTQADQLVDQVASSIGPEAGTTYTVRAYRGATLLSTISGISGTNVDLVLPPGAYQARVTVEASRGGLTSWQFQERTFPYAGGLLETQEGARLTTEEGDLLTIE
ncbi:hypothetical protein RDV84_00125 [Lysobacter yananisis]|uniref:Tip attachment protein J domain-containing protein n=1 Tax=Lysobacter yananisis TaxID=1003114 RepID=A0ABY9PAU2_9GAMM|nr:hypothetical protein [Lysobacter yananisis]WMT03296.1 hypothetical protein RDV84_00125 [Lysobacter yananisis]